MAQPPPPSRELPVLREVRDPDLEIFFEQQLDPEARRMAAVPGRDRRAFDAHWTRIRADPSNVLRTIEWESRVAGNVVSWRDDEGRKIGYWLGREFWGRGLATAALARFLAEIPERPLLAHVAKHNAASLRVLGKCGFVIVREGETLDLPGGPIQEHVLRLD